MNKELSLNEILEFIDKLSFTDFKNVIKNCSKFHEGGFNFVLFKVVLFSFILII